MKFQFLKQTYKLMYTCKRHLYILHCNVCKGGKEILVKQIPIPMEKRPGDKLSIQETPRSRKVGQQTRSTIEKTRKKNRKRKYEMIN